MSFRENARYVAGGVVLVSMLAIFLYGVEIGRAMMGLIGAGIVGALLVVCFNAVAKAIGAERISRKTLLEALAWLSP